MSHVKQKVKVLKTAVIGEDLLAFIVDNVFTEAECLDLLQLAKNKSFSDVQINKYGEKWKDPALRDNASTHIASKSLAKFLFDRVSHFLPDSVGLNRHIRFNRFSVNQRIAPHVDGEFEQTSKKQGLKSKLTFILYLNTVPSGGETRFLSAETMKHIDVKPLIGRVLFFDQRLTHAALPISQNKHLQYKYTLRSDVLYKK